MVERPLGAIFYMRYDRKILHKFSFRVRVPMGPLQVILLALFRLAFKRRVMFSLGTSMTFQTFRPTFNIHIKTSRRGGSSNHGYPDDDYFKRSLDALLANGVTMKQLD